MLITAELLEDFKNNPDAKFDSEDHNLTVPIHLIENLLLRDFVEKYLVSASGTELMFTGVNEGSSASPSKMPILPQQIQWIFDRVPKNSLQFLGFTACKFTNNACSKIFNFATEKQNLLEIRIDGACQEVNRLVERFQDYQKATRFVMPEEIELSEKAKKIKRRQQNQQGVSAEADHANDVAGDNIAKAMGAGEGAAVPVPSRTPSPSVEGDEQDVQGKTRSNNTKHVEVDMAQGEQNELSQDGATSAVVGSGVDGAVDTAGVTSDAAPVVVAESGANGSADPAAAAAAADDDEYEEEEKSASTKNGTQAELRRPGQEPEEKESKVRAQAKKIDAAGGAIVGRDPRDPLSTPTRVPTGPVTAQREPHTPSMLERLQTAELTDEGKKETLVGYINQLLDNMYGPQTPEWKKDDARQAAKRGAGKIRPKAAHGKSAANAAAKLKEELAKAEKAEDVLAVLAKHVKGDMLNSSLSTKIVQLTKELFPSAIIVDQASPAYRKKAASRNKVAIEHALELTAVDTKLAKKLNKKGTLATTATLDRDLSYTGVDITRVDQEAKIDTLWAAVGDLIATWSKYTRSNKATDFLGLHSTSGVSRAIHLREFIHAKRKVGIAEQVTNYFLQQDIDNPTKEQISEAFVPFGTAQERLQAVYDEIAERLETTSVKKAIPLVRKAEEATPEKQRGNWYTDSLKPWLIQFLNEQFKLGMDSEEWLEHVKIIKQTDSDETKESFDIRDALAKSRKSKGSETTSRDAIVADFLVKLAGALSVNPTEKALATTKVNGESTASCANGVKEPEAAAAGGLSTL